MAEQAIQIWRDRKKIRSNYFVGALFDAIGPIVVFTVLHALGVPPLAAMIWGSLAAVLSTVVNTVKRKQLDAVGILVIAEIAASIVFQLITKDTRLLLVKPSVYSAIGGIYLFSTLFRGRPLTYEGAKSMAVKGDPKRAIAYEQAWQNSPQFRKLHRISTLGWAAAFMTDAVLRVVIVYTMPMSRAVWLANVPHIAAIILLVGFSAMMGRQSAPLVEEQLGKQNEDTGLNAQFADGVPRN